MKKTLLLAAAALFATTAFADYYITGNNVNGTSWDPGAADAKFTETSTAGVYEWSGKTLGNAFKITEGDWGNDIGQGSGNLTIGTPYTYNQAQGSSDIKINDMTANDVVMNPKVTLNTNSKTVTVEGTIQEGEAPDPSDLVYYMAGDNVNGNTSWGPSEGGKFTEKGNGILEWKGTSLGTGFKITGDTWDLVNYGGNGVSVGLNEEYTLTWNGGNIAFDGFAVLSNPVVELNLNNDPPTLTFVGGEIAGEMKWYIYDLNGVGGEKPSDPGNPELVATSEDGVFVAKNVEIYETSGAFKISSTGWAMQLGRDDEDDSVFISPTNLTVDLVEVGSTGEIPYELEAGFYDITFDYNEYTVTFAVAGEGGVDGVIAAQNGEAVYYNLQGVKVSNPDKGIFVKVVDGKALKVVK